RRAVALRGTHLALQVGAMSDMVVDGATLSFIRSAGDHDIHCTFNLSDAQTPCPALPAGTWTPLAQDMAAADLTQPNLEGWQFRLALRSKG
ncbi:MAG: alpha-glucosidase, partial [Paracoccaceae bacterium]